DRGRSFGPGRRVGKELRFSPRRGSKQQFEMPSAWRRTVKPTGRVCPLSSSWRFSLGSLTTWLHSACTSLAATASSGTVSARCRGYQANYPVYLTRPPSAVIEVQGD